MAIGYSKKVEGRKFGAIVLNISLAILIFLAV